MHFLQQCSSPWLPLILDARYSDHGVLLACRLEFVPVGRNAQLRDLGAVSSNIHGCEGFGHIV